MNEQSLTLADPETALTVHQPPQPPSLFGTSDPALVLEKARFVANTLKGVIKQQKLISVISGKEYPRCEAWTLLGTMLGVFPVLIWTRKLDTGWEARVEARTRDGAVVGAAEAQCLNTERNWSNRDDFALRSMAQTRATAKCLRMPLGFVMTLAGLEATPAEEMTFERQEPPDHHTTAPPQSKRATEPREAQKPRLTATEDQRRKLIGLWEHEGKDAIHSAHGYFVDAGAILPTESLSDIPLRWVPVTTKEVRELGMHIASGRAIIPSWVTHDTSSSRQPEESPKPEVRSQKPEPSDAFTPPPEQAPTPAYVIPDGMGEETGEIQHVTLKEGKSAKGPWSLWGIKVGGVFHNTFDSKIGKAAHENKGKVVTVIYRETAKGRNVHDLYIDGKGVLA